MLSALPTTLLQSDAPPPPLQNSEQNVAQECKEDDVKKWATRQVMEIPLKLR